MAFPTPVNDQVTDSVTQSNVEVLANASAKAVGSLTQIMASSLAMAAQNTTANQQNANAINNAVTTSCVNFLLNDELTNKK